MGKMLTAVRAALRGRTTKDPCDAAAERLALGYAELIDSAAPAAKYRKALAVISRAIAGTGYEEDDPFEAFETVSTALAEHSVASDLGPKLLVTLTSLGLTTAARGEKTGGGKREQPANPVDRIKQQREQREQRRAAPAR
jgi:hypothetical protein